MPLGERRRDEKFGHRERDDVDRRRRLNISIRSYGDRPGTCDGVETDEETQPESDQVQLQPHCQLLS